MLTPGTVINETYQIVEKIGEGGGGTVFKAYHLRLQKYVVVKRINDNWVNLVESRKEADIIKNLKHQYLPQAYDFIKLQDGIYTVMDFVSGYSIDKYLKNGYRFTQQQMIFWMKQASEALAYLHSRKPPIIHSDIKPANIMINIEGNICLIDFNVSLTSTPDSFISATSRGYASPEQYLNIQPMNQPEPGKPFVPRYQFGMKVPLDERSDIYSLGATMYHMMTGNRPPRYPERIPEIPSDLEGYDEALINIVNKMIRFDPRERYQSAERLLHDLQNIRKIDKRYVRQRRARLICNTVFPIIMVGAVLISIAGYLQKGKEADEDFQTKISSADNRLDSKQYEEAEKLYQEAMKMRSDSILPYLGMMKLYTRQYDFDKAIEYGEKTLAEHRFNEEDKKNKADFYFVLGNSYFEKATEDNDNRYVNAIKYYSMAVENNKENPEYFRDYAISLARSNDIEKAKEILEQAKLLKLETASVALVNAEISYAEESSGSGGNYTDAIGYFNEAIQKSSNNDLTQRATLYLCRAYDRMKDYDRVISILDNSDSIMNDSRARVSKLMRASAYKNKANNSKNDLERTEFIKKAISLYEQVQRMGPLSKITALNLADAYACVDDFSGARTLLSKLAEDYPDDPSVFALYAIESVYEQDKKQKKDQNYDTFLQYYNKAEALNRKNKADNITVPYIADMEYYYQQLKDKNRI